MKRITAISGLLMLALFPILAPGPVAQSASADTTWSFDFRGDPLDEVLDLIAKDTGLDLAYDPTLVSGIIVYHRVRSQPSPGLLTELLKPFELDYVTLSSGTIIIVRAVRSKPAHGSFTGKIVDAENGRPLPGATILLTDASGGTATNSSGNFSINRLTSGSYNVRVSYLGYEPVYRTIQINPDEQVFERISLSPEPYDIAPLVVQAHQPNFTGSGQSLSNAERNDLEPQNRNPIRSLNLLPGVQYGLPLTDLHLQGGQQSEHRIRLDGVPIYHPYSFGEMFSSFSPFAIGDVHLKKAGFGTAEGSQISGIVDMNHDLKRVDQSGGTFQADPLTVNAQADFSILVGNGNSINMMTALRTNFWDLYRDPATNQMLRDWNRIDPLITNAVYNPDFNLNDFRPDYQNSELDILDLHVAAAYDAGDFTTWEGSFYLSGNSVLSELASISQETDSPGLYLFSADDYSWQNAAGQLSWNHLASPRLDLSAKAAFSENRFRHAGAFGRSQVFPFRSAGSVAQSDASYFLPSFSESIPLPAMVDNNRIRHFFTKADAEYTFSPSFSAEGGVQADFIRTEMSTSDQNYQPAASNETGTILSFYANSQHYFSDDLRLRWGSRFTHLSTSGNFYAEPRASVQYNRSESTIGNWSAKLAGGLYRQFINEYRITNTGATSVVPSFSVWSLAGELETPKAWHLTGSFWLEPASETRITLEGFYKYQPVTHITTYGGTPTTQEFSERELNPAAETTRMEAAGGGVRIHQNLPGTGFRLMAGYDYSYTRVLMQRQFGREMSAPWNEPHRLQARAIWRAGGSLSFIANWQSVFGRTWAWHPAYYNIVAFSGGDQSGLPGFRNPENDQLPAFHQVDLSVIWQPSVGGTDLEVRVDLINLLNRNNVIQKELQPETDGTLTSQNRRMPGFYPTASISVSF